jgi:gamma-glutamylcyclotransferase (GGCT)/AIG2-like uncharacterized protein YtfP
MQSIRTLYFACLRTSRDAGQGFEASPSNAVSPYMSKDLPFLFVYGTLRQAAKHPMHQLLARHASFVGTGQIHADLYDLGSYPGIVVATRDDASVAGEVYSLYQETAADTWRALDEYEGCSAATPAPPPYRREWVRVRLASGEVIDAWAYVLCSVPAGAIHIKSGDYLAWCRGRSNS